MSIKKTNNGSYRLRVYIPDEVQGKLGMGRRYEKRFKTRREAKEAEIKLAINIENARSGKHLLYLKIKEVYYSKTFTKKFG